MSDDIDRRISIKAEFLIADGNSDSRGWATVHRRANGVLWITSLWVHPDDRKKGYADALLRAVLREYEHEEWIYLEIAPYADRPLDSDALAVFYGKFGFYPTDVPGIMRRGWPGKRGA
jgi:GNAT superfamily N-acetyltransferase